MIEANWNLHYDKASLCISNYVEEHHLQDFWVAIIGILCQWLQVTTLANHEEGLKLELRSDWCQLIP